jgi:hypothetical protein
LRFACGEQFQTLATKQLSRSLKAARPSAVLTLTQGASRPLRDANVTVTLLEVQDFTSAGCLGGARGCPDYARINVSTPDSTQEFQLYLAHTQDQRSQGIDQAIVFGYRFTLHSVEDCQATVILERQK